MRARARELGLAVGRFRSGARAAIVDVPGVALGHATLVREPDVRAGVTIVDPCHGESAYRRKLPAAVHVANGFGKPAGLVQVAELGELETPVALTGTLSVGAVLEGLVRACQAREAGELRSINGVVLETSDARFTDPRAHPVRPEHVAEAWDAARPAADGAPLLGAAGGGAGAVCFGYKGGLGSASRVLEEPACTLGVLLQANFGGVLRVLGRPFAGPATSAGEELSDAPDAPGGSCAIVVATDAPLDPLALSRLASRAPLGLARAGSFVAHGSGDYALAFSTHPANRIEHGARGPAARTVLPGAALDPLFEALVDCVEEAVLDALATAEPARDRRGRTVPAIDPEALRRHAGLR